MFKYHPTFKFLQIHKKLADAVEEGVDFKILKTEDGVPIRKVHAQYRERTVYTVPELLYIFKFFGEVQHIEIVTKKDKRRDTFCFVTFNEANSATKILMNRHRLHELFEIHAADSWHQPDLIDSKFEAPNPPTDSEECSSATIEDLNEYCLIKIASYLDIFELLSYRSISPRLADIAEERFSKVTELNVSTFKQQKKMTLMEIRHLFYFAGRTTQTLILSSEKFDSINCTRILELIPKYCKNLQHLKLSGFRLNMDVWRKFSYILRNLKSLDLSDSCELTDEAFDCYKKGINKLETLIVANNNLITSSIMRNLKCLMKLDISNCQSIDGRILQMFSKTNLNISLTSLNISHNNLLEADVNQILKKFSSSLETLTINNYYFSQQEENPPLDLSTLENLKTLHIVNIFFPTEDQPLVTLGDASKIEVLELSSGKLLESSLYAISHLKNIKKLILNSKTPAESHLEALMVDFLVAIESLEEIHLKDCSFVNITEILRLIELSRSLNFLDLTKYYGLDNDNILEILDILEVKQKPLKLVVSQTDVDYNILENPIYLSNKHLIELIWRKADEDSLHDYDIDERVNLVEVQEQQENYNWNDVIEILKMTEDESKEQFMGLFKIL